MTRTGLDRLITERFQSLKGQRIALLCNQASVASDRRHVIDHFQQAQIDIQCVLGPQHGIWGHTQDNMVEWEGGYDQRTGQKFYSLYGKHREPSDEMLEKVDRLVVDLQDVGARYYTFIWSLALCMKACQRNGVPITVLDRPNPIGGMQAEGPILDPSFASFVGLHPLPIRHGLTIGEIAMHSKKNHYPNCELEVVKLEGWNRNQYFDETGLPWVMPSPNMPTLDTAIVYPGQCLLEGTNLSEGRGTTRPFETFGAPFIDAWKLCDALNDQKLGGAYFRPIQFQPTFQKFAGEVCQGAFIHVTDRETFRPVITTVAILQTIKNLWPNQFAWRQPPYEYEDTLLPIDIIAGTDRLRHFIENSSPLTEIEAWIDESNQTWQAHRAALI